MLRTTSRMTVEDARALNAVAREWAASRRAGERAPRAIGLAERAAMLLALAERGGRPLETSHAPPPDVVAAAEARRRARLPEGGPAPEPVSLARRREMLLAMPGAR